MGCSTDFVPVPLTVEEIRTYLFSENTRLMAALAESERHAGVSEAETAFADRTALRFAADLDRVIAQRDAALAECARLRDFIFRARFYPVQGRWYCCDCDRFAATQEQVRHTKSCGTGQALATPASGSEVVKL